MVKEVVLTKEDIEKKAKKELKALQKIDSSMSELQAAMSENPQFQQFLAFQDSFNKKQKDLFKKLEEQMIANGVEKIEITEGDLKGSYIRISSRKTWKVVDEELVPKEYKKKVTSIQVDMAQIKEDAELTGEVPEGISLTDTQFLQKKIKNIKALES